MHWFTILTYFSICLLSYSSADVVIYSSRGYKMTIVNNDPNFRQDTRQRCINTFFATYPTMCDRFNRNKCPREVKITIDPNYNGVAYAGGNSIVVAARWFAQNPQDTDVITHEGMHVVQGYPAGSGPSWLIEGIADYARWKYGQNNRAANWFLPSFNSAQRYTDSYRVTARFLAWCEKYYNTIVNELDCALRNGNYQSTTWMKITKGKTIDQLWNEYSRNSNL